jgi:hypothetical protein
VAVLNGVSTSSYTVAATSLWSTSLDDAFFCILPFIHCPSLPINITSSAFVVVPYSSIIFPSISFILSGVCFSAKFSSAVGCSTSTVSSTSTSGATSVGLFHTSLFLIASNGNAHKSHASISSSIFVVVLSVVVFAIVLSILSLSSFNLSLISFITSC